MEPATSNKATEIRPTAKTEEGIRIRFLQFKKCPVRPIPAAILNYLQGQRIPSFMNKALTCPNANYEYRIFKPFIIYVLENPAGDGEPYTCREWVKTRFYVG
jgi:hypothetical protein